MVGSSQMNLTAKTDYYVITLYTQLMSIHNFQKWHDIMVANQYTGNEALN